VDGDQGTRWIRERGSDLLPHLVWMAVTERWHALTGVRGRLDARAEREIAAALHAMAARSVRAVPYRTREVPAPGVSPSTA
jgi:hypothetical protein